VKILIATNNVSKFGVVVPLLKYAGLEGYEYIQPSEVGVTLDVDETGSLQNRARQKAAAAFESIKKLPILDEFYMFVGSDDGIRIERDKKTYTASKETTDRILSGRGIEVGDQVSIVRSFAFITKDSSAACTTRVPMVFLGNPQHVTRQEGTYPLEYVLAYKHIEAPIHMLSESTRNVLNQKYMAVAIRRTLAKLGVVSLSSYDDQ
jgi:hypothetical protein